MDVLLSIFLGLISSIALGIVLVVAGSFLAELGEKHRILFILVVIGLSALMILFFWKRILGFLFSIFVILILILAGIIIIGWLNSSARNIKLKRLAKIPSNFTDRTTN